MKFNNWSGFAMLDISRYQTSALRSAIMARVLVLFSIFLLGVPKRVIAQNGLDWNKNNRGEFVMSTMLDDQGRYWFGTEDEGVWRFDPLAKKDTAWKHFTTSDGLGDNNAYALTCDFEGRVWVGHLNHGVSVFNGESWRNYDVLTGPLGERTWDIKVSPNNGDVWIATNRGLSRYEIRTKKWTYYTRFTGLPSDQISCLDIDEDGTVYVGTQCDGIAIGSPDKLGEYAEWTQVEGPEKMTWTAKGVGLPSNLINDILVGERGEVYAATNCGLARSDDKGRSWFFIRGADWQEKVKGQFPPGVPSVDKFSANLLLEDYTTTIFEDSKGLIWLGHPEKGVEVRSPGAIALGGGGVIETIDEQKNLQRIKRFEEEMNKVFYSTSQEQDMVGVGVPEELSQLPELSTLPKVPGLDQSERADYITSILETEDGSILASGYGSGVVIVPKIDVVEDRGINFKKKETASFPTAAAAPTPEDLKSFLDQIVGLNESIENTASFLGDDWKTQGNWVGRYGSRSATLCAMQSPLDHNINNDLSYRVEGRLGWHAAEDDTLRHWMHRKRWDDPRVLYNPLIGYRRQADWDDHGEVYPRSHEGPDIWVGLRLPPGIHRISLYFFNKDGHDGSNRTRDYVIKIKKGKQNLLEAEQQPTLAKARVRDFWGPVYKQFIIHGEGDYYAKIEKNNSFNAILQGVFIDKLAGPSTEDELGEDVWLRHSKYKGPSIDQLSEARSSLLKDLFSKKELEAAEQENLDFLNMGKPRKQNEELFERSDRIRTALELWTNLDDASGKQSYNDYEQIGRVLAYRAIAALGSDKQSVLQILTLWRWKLPLWTQLDKNSFEKSMAETWQSLVEQNPELKNSRG